MWCILVIDDDSGTRPAPKDAAPMTRDMNTIRRKPLDAIPLVRSVSVRTVYILERTRIRLSSARHVLVAHTTLL